MTFSVNLFRALPLLLMGLMLSGCLPSAQSPLDEEKESHFLAGKSRVNAMDYKGAIECFEKSLEVNPQSGAAHLELGVLYEKEDIDPSIAIYHYGQYLKLQPNAGNADIVKQHILACKQELARTVSLGPVSERQQRDLEKLVEDNKRLADDNKRLTEEVGKWRIYYASRMQQQPGQSIQSQPLTPAQPGAVETVSNTVVGRGVQPAGGRAAAGNSNAAPVGVRSGTPPTTPRSHVVRQGETLSLIAREYGVKPEMIQRYNPRLDPRRMKVGQTLNIPPP